MVSEHWKLITRQTELIEVKTCNLEICSLSLHCTLNLHLQIKWYGTVLTLISNYCESKLKLASCFWKSWNRELYSCCIIWISSAYSLMSVGFFTFTVGKCAILFDCNWSSHNRNVLSNAVILANISLMSWFILCRMLFNSFRYCVIWMQTDKSDI
jgi:hypothetical protein